MRKPRLLFCYREKDWRGSTHRLYDWPSNRCGEGPALPNVDSA
jgi:hypothetical protein